MHASAGATGAGGSSAEKEREGAYKLAAHLSNSLDSTSGSLTSLIQTLNALSPSFSHATTSASGDAQQGHHQQGQGQDDPLAQIASILNAHLGSLTWIEGSTEQLRRAVRDLEARVAGVQGRAAAQGMGVGTPARLGASVGGGGGGRASPFARRA